MKITRGEFGIMPDGGKASLFTLDAENGFKAVISDLGGDIINLFVPGRDGISQDVVLGYGSFEAYLRNPNFFGAIVGRNANRIAGANIEIAGKTYELEKNDGSANLHSGRGNMTFKVFDAETSVIDGKAVLSLSLTQKDMSDGFPGNLKVKVTYTLDDNGIIIDYYAVSDADTVINMTNHSYFNLAGHGSGNIYDQKLKLEADFYTPNNDGCCPTGEILSVEGTPMDFRMGREFGKDINSNFEQIKMFGGYDHNFAIGGRGFRKVAEVSDVGSGRVMEAWTDQNGIQLFTSNGDMSRVAAKDGASYARHQGFCLETQTFPNAAEMPWLLSPIYKAGQEYRTKTAYCFKVQP